MNATIATPPPSTARPLASASVSEPVSEASRELAWARSRWPAELRRVQIGSHLSALKDWLADVESIPIWLSSPIGECAPGTLTRIKDQDELVLVVYSNERTEQGVRVRDYNDGTVSDELDLGGSGGRQIQAADGTWQDRERWSQSDVGSWGHLSKVTHDLARFAGRWVDLRASCAGPTFHIDCQSSVGNQGDDCSTCSEVRVTVSERDMGMMRTHVAAVPRIGCSCPTPENPDLDRVAALFSSIDPWAVTDASDADAPTLYRTLAACSAGKTR
ncbi:MAG: hypothetical protein U0271_11080 [Polyangiaceae bacterium]